MHIIEFEGLLGKHLFAVEETVNSNFRKSITEKLKIHLHFSQNFNMDFYGIFSHKLFIETDKDDVVKAITIHFGEVINRQFYDSFVKQYGKPNTISIIDKRTIISGGVDKTSDGFFSNISKSELSLREGTFEEKPLFMIWEKDGYYIQAFLRHKQNISEIMFSTESPPFNVKPNKP